MSHKQNHLVKFKNNNTLINICKLLKTRLKMLFKNAVAFVTGGASGLGLATVQRFARAGSKVVLGDLKTSKGNEVAKEIGENVVFVPVDVTSGADVKQALEVAEEKFGRLDVTVSCAGISRSFITYNFNQNTSFALEDFSKLMEVNTVGTFNVIRLSAGLIGRNKPNEDGQRGIIVNTASYAAFDGQIGQAGIAASNAAIIGMTLPIARDLSSQGIRVVTIAPGYFDTPLTQHLPLKVQAFLAKTVAFPQRFGYPEEFAQMVETIVDNPIINGECIRLDGGLRAMH